MHGGNETLSWQIHISGLERLLQPRSVSARCMQILPACTVYNCMRLDVNDKQADEIPL